MQYGTDPEYDGIRPAEGKGARYWLWKTCSNFRRNHHDRLRTPDRKADLLRCKPVELTGGKLFVYLAGTTTKATSYTETDGLVANSNPITLNSRGEVPSEALCRGGATYKLVLAPSTDTDPPTSDLDRITCADYYVAPTTRRRNGESGGQLRHGSATRSSVTATIRPFSL